MQQQKILNLSNEANNSKFATRKCNIDNDNQKASYKEGSGITYNKELLKSNLFDYSDAYILIRGDITVTALTQIQVSFTIVHHLLNVSQKLTEQRQMILKI